MIALHLGLSLWFICLFVYFCSWLNELKKYSVCDWLTDSCLKKAEELWDTLTLRQIIFSTPT